MLGEIRAMQVYTMTRKNSKKYLHSTISYKYKIVLWKYFYAGSQIRAVQIRAMRNRASQGMTVLSTPGPPLGCGSSSTEHNCFNHPQNVSISKYRRAKGIKIQSNFGTYGPRPTVFDEMGK